MTRYTKQDTVDTLSAEQLELMVKTQSDVLLTVIKDTTIFDVHRIRLMLELGGIEAGRRLQALERPATQEGDK